ncbi:ATP-binding protein, partial [Sinirhodobacter huangdaonensis]
MRLDRLDLARYGRFTDTVLDFPAPEPGGPDLHVLFGPNEAGKSTIFSAWLDLLFGIPLRSRYDFLHPGPTMRIGATIRTEAGPLALSRIKRSTASLLDAHGAPLPETVLQAALGGLGREGYGAMFSLDDDTLERGGDSILASRGDLGEMLFSASAGLAGLGPELETMRTELDAFHAPGKRKGAVREAKARLGELDRARRDLDTSAAAAQKLAREVAAAEEGWTRTRAAADA